MRFRTYTEMLRCHGLTERYEYLKLSGEVGAATFGFDRWMNQGFYRSRQWKLVRQEVLARDLGCDLAVEGYEIYDRPIIHHMNPMSSKDIEAGLEEILDPEFLITTSHNTHNAIHYGTERLLPRSLTSRQRGDTKLW